jgi:hypothetical protein
MSSGHKHNSSAGTQNQGNSLGDRSCVRYSMLTNYDDNDYDDNDYDDCDTDDNADTDDDDANIDCDEDN